MWTKSEGRRGIGGDSLATDETRIEHGTGPRPVLRTVYIRRSVEREGFIKFLTVRNLISGWAATARDFQRALLERWRGGIDRPVTKAKQRSQRRACPKIPLSVAQATGLCRPIRVRRGSADIPVGGCWGLSSPQFLIADNIAELESSANPQAGKPALLATASPFRSGRPCYPFYHSTHSTTNHYRKSCQISH